MCKNNFPEQLFMYFRVENAKSFLENHKIKFSNLTQVNDPFELMIDFRKSMKDTGFDATRSIASDEINDRVIFNLGEKIKEDLQDIGVACFTETDDNVLMWAYYGGCQRGICIEFNLLEDVFFASDIYQVMYKSYFESIKKENDKFNYYDILTTKSEEWTHEKEWRVIKEGYAGKFCSINPRAIKSIILGPKFMEYKESEVIQVHKEIFNKLKVKKEYSHIKIKQVQCDNEKYKMYSKELPFLIIPSDNEGIVIISLRDQNMILMADAGKIIYQDKMLKWEERTIKSSNGYYDLYNPETDEGSIRFHV